MVRLMTMRDLAGKESLHQFMAALGEIIRKPTQVFFTGGATALLWDFRPSTVDIDFKFLPESDEMYQAIRQLKEKLGLNLEIASADFFVPLLPQAENRHQFIVQKGKVSFYHLDPYTQILAKVERGWETDLLDAKNILGKGVDPEQLKNLFNEAENSFLKYPNLEFETLKKKLLRFLASHK